MRVFNQHNRSGCLPTLKTLKTLKKEIYFRIYRLIEIYEHVFLSQKTQNISNLKALYEI